MSLARDRAAADFAAYAPEKIGRTRYRTPEGFLVCEGVRIARTGPMMYAPDEMPEIEQGPLTAMITVMRDADVLFDPDTIRSFAGKAVTNDHPPEPVTPANFKIYAVGTVMDPRRGEGVESEYLIADLLIADAGAIDDIEAGKIEISAGYDVEVEQIKPGLARQTKNLGNHVALVDRARGGSALSIQDHAEEPAMATRTTRKILDGIRKAFKAKDEAALEENLNKAEEAMDDEEDGDGDKTIVIKVEGAAAPAAETADEGAGDKPDPYEERFSKIEDTLGKISDAFEGLKASLSGANDGESDGDKDKDGEGKAADEEAKAEEEEVEKAQAQDAMSKAEILAPGIKLAALDAAKVKRADVTAARRTTLKTALADSGRKVHVEAVLGGRDIDKLRPGEVAMVFDAAAAVARANNNASRVRPFDVPQGAMTPAKLQERIRERRKEHYGVS